MADHIEAKEHFTAGEFFNLDGLQGICRDCHEEKTFQIDLPKRSREKLLKMEFF